MSRLSEITQKQRDRLRENANRMAGGIPFIQYDGESVQFKLGETDVTDNNFLSVPDRCEAVWICFSGGTVKELVRVNMLDEDIPSRPQGYSDRQKWDTWDKGRNEGQPKDPLMLQYELPLVTLDFARDEPRLQDRLHAHS